jgi:hypothetical protein
MIQMRSMWYQIGMSRTKCHNDTMSLTKFNLKETKNG